MLNLKKLVCYGFIVPFLSISCGDDNSNGPEPVIGISETPSSSEKADSKDARTGIKKSFRGIHFSVPEQFAYTWSIVEDFDGVDESLQFLHEDSNSIDPEISPIVLRVFEKRDCLPMTHIEGIESQITARDSVNTVSKAKLDDLNLEGWEIQWREFNSIQKRIAFETIPPSNSQGSLGFCAVFSISVVPAIGQSPELDWNRPSLKSLLDSIYRTIHYVKE